MLKAFPLGICRGRSCDHPAHPEPHLALRKAGIRASTDTACARGHHNTREVELEADSEGRKGLGEFAELCLHFAFRGFHLFLSFPNDWRGNMHSNQTCHLKVGIRYCGALGFKLRLTFLIPGLILVFMCRVHKRVMWCLRRKKFMNNLTFPFEKVASVSVCHHQCNQFTNVTHLF